MENIELLEGTKVPDFKLAGSDKKEHSLSDYLGKRVVLYFYPKDNTPGCSLEAQDFRDHKEELDALNAIVLGVSRDDLASHDKFVDKFCLPFILLSDEDEALCNLFTVLKEKNMYGKKSIGIERSTFIIDEEGILRVIYRKVKVEDHVETVIKALKTL